MLPAIPIPKTYAACLGKPSLSRTGGGCRQGRVRSIVRRTARPLAASEGAASRQTAMRPDRRRVRANCFCHGVRSLVEVGIFEADAAPFVGTTVNRTPRRIANIPAQPDPIGPVSSDRSLSHDGSVRGNHRVSTGGETHGVGPRGIGHRFTVSVENARTWPAQSPPVVPGVVDGRNGLVV